MSHLANVSYLHMDLNKTMPDVKADTIYRVDVIEHLEPEGEAQFVKNMVECLTPDGVFVTGTPNVAAEQYVSERSGVQHINLKSIAELRDLMERYFENVFMSGMNDEILHTGYAPMCHYIWSLAVGKKIR